MSENKLKPAASEFIIVAPIAKPDADGPAKYKMSHKLCLMLAVPKFELIYCI